MLSYTLYLAEIDAGRVPNIPAPAIARQYWGLPKSATLRDVLLAVRADEAHHRDVNHSLAAELGGASPAGNPSAYPWHASTTELTPHEVGPYRVTVDFTQDNLPAALQKEHNTAKDVWAVIRVKEGNLRLTHLGSGKVEMLDAHTPGYVTPLSPHFVEPVGPIKVCIEFYDQDPKR